MKTKLCLIAWIITCIVLVQACGTPDTAAINTTPVPTLDEKAAYPASPAYPAPGVNAIKPTIPPLSPRQTAVGIARTPAGAGIIVEGGQIPTKDYTIQNHWYTTTAIETIGVYAGSFTDDPSQGVLLITYRTMDEMQATRKSIHRTTAKKVGTLRILDANDMNLIIQAQDGTKFIFNVTSTQFEQ